MLQHDTGKFAADSATAFRVTDEDQILAVMFIKIRQYHHMPDGFAILPGLKIFSTFKKSVDPFAAGIVR